MLEQPGVMTMKDEGEERRRRRQGQMTRKSREIRVSLCGGEKCCPEVVVTSNRHTVRIGEAGNRVTLEKRAWNALVEKIQAGELKKL